MWNPPCSWILEYMFDCYSVFASYNAVQWSTHTTHLQIEKKTTFSVTIHMACKKASILDEGNLWKGIDVAFDALSGASASKEPWLGYRHIHKVQLILLSP